MTNAELLAELRGAPCPQSDGIRHFRPLFNWFCDCSMEACATIGDGKPLTLERLPDAITEAIEYLERQVAIEWCEHNRHISIGVDLHTGNTVGALTCFDCGAEYHNGSWI